MSGEVIIVTGAPGSGKSTVAALLAETATVPTVHLDTDLFYHSIRSGFVLPFLPEAQRQNEVVIDAIVATVASFARGGYDVVVDGIVGPWFLPPFRALLSQGLRVSYFVLRPVLQVTIERAHGRGDDSLKDVAAITDLHGAFERLEDLEHLAIDSGALDAHQTCELVRARLTVGAHLLK